MDRVDGKMDKQTQRTKLTTQKVVNLIKKQKCNCVLYMIIALEIILLVIQVSSNNFTMGYTFHRKKEET